MTAGVNSLQWAPPMYSQQGCFGNGNLFGDDIFYGNDDLLQSSVFNNGGMMPGLGGFGGSMWPQTTYNSYAQIPPMNEGESAEDYGKRVKSLFGVQNEIQNDLQNAQLKRQIENQNHMNGINFTLTSESDAITRRISILQSKIKANEQDDIMDCYNKLLNAVKKQLTSQGINIKDVSSEQLKAYAEKLYLQTTGKSLTDEISEYGSGQFGNGFKKGIFGLGWLFCNKRTAKDNIAEITGEEVSKTDKLNQALGTATSGILAGGMSLLGLLKFFKR